jgi:hypothetical protein
MSFEAIQQSVRAETGTSLTYEEDWHTLWDSAGIADGEFNERMLLWINDRLGTSYQDINDAMQAFAEDEGYSSFGEIGTFTAGSGGPSGDGLLLESGDYLLLESGDFLLLE